MKSTLNKKDTQQAPTKKKDANNSFLNLHIKNEYGFLQMKIIT